MTIGLMSPLPVEIISIFYGIAGSVFKMDKESMIVEYELSLEERQIFKAALDKILFKEKPVYEWRLQLPPDAWSYRATFCSGIVLGGGVYILWLF